MFLFTYHDPQTIQLSLCLMFPHTQTLPWGKRWLGTGRKPADKPYEIAGVSQPGWLS